MKKMTSLRFEQEILNKIKEIADTNHRTLTNQIEFILLDYIKKYNEPKSDN